MILTSKWSFLTQACKDLHFFNAAKVASKIEATLGQIYGASISTADWERDKRIIYDEYKDKLNSGNDIFVFLQSIMNAPQYCIACVETYFNTSRVFCYINCLANCEFAKQVGVCSNVVSLFYKFKEAFLSDMISNKKLMK